MAIPKPARRYGLLDLWRRVLLFFIAPCRSPGIARVPEFDPALAAIGPGWIYSLRRGAFGMRGRWK